MRDCSKLLHGQDCIERNLRRMCPSCTDYANGIYTFNVVVKLHDLNVIHDRKTVVSNLRRAVKMAKADHIEIVSAEEV